MRKLKLYIANSIDGKIAAKDGGIDWLPDPSQGDYGYEEFYSGIDTVVMGWETYSLCAGFEPWPYQDKECYVFSRHPEKDVLPQAMLITEDIPEFIRGLKEIKGQDIWLVGGGKIVSLLHDAGLIDEYIIATIPVILGEGIGLFPSITQKTVLKLIKNEAYENGLLLSYYEKQ